MLFTFPRERGKVGMGTLRSARSVAPTPTLPRMRGREMILAILDTIAA
jgi:hypothetical protein